MLHARVRSAGLLLLAFVLGASPGCGSSSPAAPATGTGTGGTAGDGGPDPFVLAWQDDFDTLDATRWQLQTFTFGGNLAQFTPQNAGGRERDVSPSI